MAGEGSGRSAHDPSSGDAARTAVEAAGDWIADRARHVADNGLGPLTGSVPYAEARLARVCLRHGIATDGDLRGVITRAVELPESNERMAVEATIDRIITESMSAAGTTGLITGIGGLSTMFLTIPADVAGNFVINARMVGAIAYLRGYDLDDPHAETMFLLTVAGSSGQAIVSSFGVRVGREGAKAAIRAIPVQLLREINKKAGFYLVAKYGTKRAAATLVKAVPLAGGVVSGGINVALTRSIGKTAMRAFAY